MVRSTAFSLAVSVFSSCTATPSSTLLSVMTSAAAVASNCKRIGHFSIESHHCSGAILHSFCIFNRKIEKKLAFILPFAVTNHKQSQSPPQLGCHGCFLRDGLFVIAGVNGTVTEVGSLAAASAVARQALADADAAAGPGGLILGGIVLGLAVGYCCAACGKKKQDTKGYKPVTFNQE